MAGNEGVPAPAVAQPAPTPRFRRSHPYKAFVLMTAPFLALVAIVLLPFIGWIVLFVLLPIEFGRIGGRRIARSDALWVAAPAGLAVGTYELALALSVLGLVPGTTLAIDFLGTLFALAVYGCNMCFFSVGALSTSFDPNEPVDVDAGAPTSA